MYATAVQRAACRWRDSDFTRGRRAARVSEAGIHAQDDEGMRVLSPASRLQPEWRREVLRRAQPLAQRLHVPEAQTVALAKTYTAARTASCAAVQACLGRYPSRRRESFRNSDC